MAKLRTRVSTYSELPPALEWDYDLCCQGPPGTDGLTLYLLDWGPLAFLAMSRLERLGERQESSWGSWLQYQLNGGLLRALDPHWDWDKARFVLLGDRKPYWRSRYVSGYKSGRTAKPTAYHPLTDRVAVWAKDHGLPHVQVAGYEADDLAGQIVRAFRLGQLQGYSRIVLHTVDTDWLQLVGGGVAWINTSKQQPYYRDAQEAIAYVRERLGEEITQPWEIAEVKCRLGDPSDSLYPPEDGTVPYGLVSLYSVPQEYSQPIENLEALVSGARQPDPTQARAAYYVLLADNVWLGV